MKKLNRRDFLLLLGAANAALTVGLPGLAFADEAAEQKAKAEAAMKAFTGGKEAAQGSLILEAPDVAENGGQVPVAISMKGVKPVRVALVVDHNPVPTALDAAISPKYAGDAKIAVRIKMKRSSLVRAYAYDEKGKLHGAGKNVTVTLGGCG